MTDTAHPVTVSVVTLTYNQERFIRQALDSILTQECDFTFECIVGDDCSTDGTREILGEYERRYPDRLHPVLRETNVGARHNLADVLKRCRGRYVAILDGDDFWTTPHKLERQVAFMEAHPDCAVSFHDVRAIDENGNDCDVPVSYDRPERSEIEDLLCENFISTCTVMYRWGLVDGLPSWWDKTWVSDYTLHVLHARHGWIGYIDDVMAAYRVHGEGMWSGQRQVDRLEEFTKTLRLLDEEFGRTYHDLIESTIHAQIYNEFAERFDLASRLFHRGKNRAARRHVPWLLLHINRRGKVPVNSVAVLVVRSTMPWLVEPVVSLKAVARRMLGRKTDGEDGSAES